MVTATLERPAEKEERQKRVIDLEDIPLISMKSLRDWLYRNGQSPAMQVDDPDLREAIYEHLELIKFALEDPINFGIAIGLDVFPQQVMTTKAVLENGKVAIRGCHSSGKSFMLAVIAVWWLLHYEDSAVITTAPTKRQVGDIMWGDINYLVPLAAQKLRLAVPECKKTQWDLAPKNMAYGVSTDKTVNFQGYHSQNTLIIMDEAPGIASDLWGAIEGITSSGNVRIVMAGNPTIVSGMFYEASTSEKHEEWTRINYSALRDNPNVMNLPLSEWELEKKPKGLSDLELGRLATLVQCEIDDPLLEQDVTPHMVSRRWIRERWFAWGDRDLPDWYSRVCGEFPPEDEMTLIPRSAIDYARRPAELTLENATRIQWGIDVAGYGQNETVLIAQQDLHILGMWVVTDADARIATQEIIRPHIQRSSVMRIDQIGIGWYFFVDMARWASQWVSDIEVIGVDVGKNPRNPKDYFDLRSEIYFMLREFLIDKRLAGLFDDELCRQLSSLRWETVERGSKRKLESKKDMKERGVPSPDKADALALACCGHFEESVEESGQTVTWQAEDDFEISPY